MAERIQRVMVVTAHPDDSEFGAGGTVAKLVKEGRQVTYCILTNGDKGSGDRSMTPERLAAIREEEQKNAARVLGVEVVDFLGFPDCELEDTRESRRAVIAIDCVYPLARDHMAFPELLEQGLEPHKVKEIYMMWWDSPEVVVDTTETMDLKLKALACHVSQIKDMAALEKRIRERGAELGKPHGYAYAETFERIVMDR